MLLWWGLLPVMGWLLTAAQSSSQNLLDRVLIEIDPDTILDNDRIMDFYLKCIFNEGPCDRLGEDMKEAIPEVIRTVCERCTDEQKAVFRYSSKKFIGKRPKDWERLLSIYDPEGVYWPKIKAFLDQAP